MLGTIPSYSNAESQYTRELESVIIRVKSLFTISDDYDTFDSRINTSGDKVYFYLNWSDSNKKLDRISISTDSKGNVISYNEYKETYVEPETKLPSFTRIEAIQKAEDFIYKVDEDVSKQIRLTEVDYRPSVYDRAYYLQFHRVKDNIPFLENSLRVSVDKYSGEITDYYITWDRDLVFPDSKKAISLEKANQIFEDEIGLDLLYKKSYRIFRYDHMLEDSNYFLAYGILNESQTIDAITGEIYKSDFYYGEDTAEDKENVAAGITPVEQGEIDKLKDIKTIDQIEQAAREIVEIEDEYKLEYKNLNMSWKNPGEYEWSLSFAKALDDGKYENINVVMNARSSNLISFRKFINIPEEAKPAINMEEALELAKEYIQKIDREKYIEIEYTPAMSSIYQKDGQKDYGFNFMRKVDQAYVTTDHISVSVDAVGSQIYGYNLNWFNGELPSMEGAISKDKAYEIFFDELGFELQYRFAYDYNKPEAERREVRLIYGPKDARARLIDPYSGELLDYSGKPYDTKKDIVYKDIEGSYAKGKIETLAEYGVGFSSESFAPTEKIAQKDFLYLLWKAMNPYRSETEDYIDNICEELMNTKIINASEINYNKKVTKEDAVKYVIKAKNLSELADLENIYADIWEDSKDINPGLKGYMNLAYGLKIIVGNGPSVQPKYELQRQDAASIIYNYLFM